MKRKLSLMLICMLLLIGLTVLFSCNKPEEEEEEPELTITLSANSLSLVVGESSTLTATISIEGLVVEWTTSNSAVATVVGGKVDAVSAGTATITAKSGTVSATCLVTVVDPEPEIDPTIVEEEEYGGEISFSNALSLDEIDLTEGLTATDSEGTEIDIIVSNDGGFDITKLGTYTITYKATDANGRFATFTRIAKVTYFGLDKETINSKEVSKLTSWTYVAEFDEDKTAMEWGQKIVPGHSTNWNKFEGPIGMPYIVMHGSDTNGREQGSSEVDDEYPNTILYNKVTIDDENTVFRVFLSNNPYPDYNNLLSKVRLTVLNLTTYKSTVIGGYREIKAPLNDTKDGLNYEYMRNLTYEDFDLSAFAGQTVMLCIEQDAPAEVYQWDYYKDIGYLDFQIQPLIAETRDTLVVYSMSFVKAEEKIDLSTIPLDTATSWGTDSEDAGSWGLRGDEAAKAKWRAVFLNGGIGSLNNVDGTGASLQLIAREPEGINDGVIRIPDAALVNKANVGTNKFFEIYIGTDTDNVNVNYRLSFYLSDGTKVTLSPLFVVDGYTPLGNDWATIQKCQWTHGVKLLYDVEEFANQEVVIAIEIDENFEAGVGNCTLWVNKIRFVDDITFAPADYTEYNTLKAEVEATNYEEKKYTEMSWSIFSEALVRFNAIPKDLVNEQQSDINAAITNLQDAINLLTIKPDPVTPPNDPTSGTLSENILNFDDDAWKADDVDPSGVWGTDAENPNYWGLRGDTAAKSAWKWYIGDGNGMLNGVSSLKMTMQSIAYEQGNDTEAGWAADALFANKVWVRGEYFVLHVGCDDNNGTVNVRLRVVKSDGTIVILNPISYNAEQVTTAQDGWLTIHYSQWVFGTKLVYDFTNYNDAVVTILVEQDQNETASGTSCTLWFNKAEFIKGADYTAYNTLKAEVTAANYQAENYTVESFTAYTQALENFNNVSLKLTVKEQGVLDGVITALENAITGLVELGGTELAESVLGLNTSTWKAMEVDNKTEWGDDNADAGAWGLRGTEDLETKKDWKYFPGANATLYHLDNPNASLQSIAYETDDDVSGMSVDALFANKVLVSKPYFMIYVGCDTADNLINIRLRVILEDGTFVIVNPLEYTTGEYTPLENGWGTVKAGQWVYGTKIKYDFSTYNGKEITILLEQDSYSDTNPTLWFNRAVFENAADYTAYNTLKAEVTAANYQAENYTVESFAAYTQALENFNNVSLKLTVKEQGVLDGVITALENAITGLVEDVGVELAESVLGLNTSTWKAMEVDNKTEWGDDNADAGAWGLRGTEDLETKKDWKYFPGANATLYHLDNPNASLQSIAYETDDDVSGMSVDALFANKVLVSKPYFMIYVGCDTADNLINIRLRVILEDGTFVIVNPLEYTTGEYTPLENGWGTVKAGQWVYGTKIKYDFSTYNGKEITILLEQDSYSDTNPTLWFNRAVFENAADYTAYNTLKAEVTAANYQAENYTVESFAAYTQALENFNNVSLKLTVKEQGVLDGVITALENAITGLVEDVGVELAESVLGLNTSTWKAMEVDNKTEWGDDNADAGAWGLRGTEDLETKKDWKYFPSANATLYHLDNPNASLQSIAYETDDDVSGMSVDALFANKVLVSKPYFMIYVGCDTADNLINIRLRVILEDGTFVIVNPLEYTTGEYTPLENGWGTVKAGQWVYGTKIKYDFSTYNGKEITILLEQDSYSDTNPTLWFNRAVFENAADYTAYNTLKAEVTAANYQAENYTVESFAAYTQALENFNNVSLKLTVKEQGVLDGVITALENAITGLVEDVGVELAESVLGLNTSTWKAMEVDNKTEWGDDNADAGLWGLRGTEDLETKKDWKYFPGANATLYHLDNPNASLQSIAYETDDDVSGMSVDALFANKVLVSKPYFMIYVGCDTADNLINIRLRVILEDGTFVIVNPLEYTTGEYTPLENGWGTVKAGQWVYGTKIKYDFSTYNGKEITILLEQDSYSDTNPTLWFNRAVFENAADYTAYNTLKAEVTAANYQAENYTVESFAVYTQALENFNNVSLKLTVKEQGVLDGVITALENAITGLVEDVGVELAESVLGLNTSTWKAMEVDNKTEWGDDNADAGLWGLRGTEDLETKKDWKYFPGANATLYHLDNPNASLQSIAYETDDDVSGMSVDALFANKVLVSKPYFMIYVGCDTADNLINIRLRVILEDGTFVIVNPLEYTTGEYTPLENGWGTVKAGQWVYGTKIKYDFSTYNGKEITILLEQDSYSDTNPTLWFNRAVFENAADYTAYNTLKAEVTAANYQAENYTVESFAVYTQALENFNNVSLKLTVKEQGVLDGVITALENAITGLVEDVGVELAESVLGLNTSTWKAMEVDNKTEWGDDNADAGLWGLRGTEDLETKKDWKYFPGANATLYHLDNPNASLQSIAYETDDDVSGMSVDALFANKVLVSKPYFMIYVGCDTADNLINIRLRVILEDGTFVIVNPLEYTTGEYTPLENGWGTVKAGQWVYGTKIKYDFSTYNGKEITILLEQDSYSDTNPTLWFNRAVFENAADYTAYNTLKAEVTAANYQAENYTVESFAVYTQALENFNNVSLKLTVKEQGVLDGVITALENAITGLVEDVGVELAESVLGLNTSTWKAMEVDNKTEWGDDNADAGAWGLRGTEDLETKKDWKYFPGANATLYHLDNPNASLQSIAYETDDDVSGMSVDALFANKVLVSKPYFMIYVGCDTADNLINIRLRVILEDGTFVIVNPLEYTTGEYTPLENGWGTVKAGQWVYGTKIKYDFSTYNGKEITILLEQDSYSDTNPTLWFNRAVFTDPTLQYSIWGFDDAAWKAMEVDNKTEWGDDNADAGLWGLRGTEDLETKKDWKYFPGTNATLHQLDNPNASLQSIAYETDDDVSGMSVDALFANKVIVSKDKFVVTVGCDGAANSINVRISLVLSNGTIVNLTPSKTSSKESATYTALEDGWGTVTGSQWVYGLDIEYDMSAYSGQTVTILLEQDAYDGSNPTLWLNRLVFVN
ncbi:MAG: immunoglobulin-like domain-containing protein [Acholeplasmataceae bacterium]